MGLKTNKSTKTSRLNCQYVGSFSVKDGDKKLSTSEQNRIVDAKLKNCTKKLIDGMPVFLQVSPDGIQVLASDEKTVKMAHTLRRVSYATVEPTNKLFAYVSHQPGSDMDVVCHTFVTKKKDHAEGLSAALGKLFKQTFAYTLKRRDKLEEAAQKRGANRRWAKQQVAEGHGAVPRNGRVVAKARSVDEQRKEDGVPPRTVAQQKPNQSMASTTNDIDGRPRRKSPPGNQNRSTSLALDNPSSTSATVNPPPKQSRQDRPVCSQTLPSEWETPFVPPPSPPKQARQDRANGGSSTLPPEWETPFVPPAWPPTSTQPTSPFDDSPFAPSWPTGEEPQPPPLPSRPRPHASSPWTNQSVDVPPELPSRNYPPRRSSNPSSPGSEIPPALPKPRRYSSDSSIGFGASGYSEVPPNAAPRDPGERKLSAPPNLMPASPTRTPVRVSHSSDSSVEGSPTHRPVFRDMESTAAALLARADDTPPPLPRRGRQSGSQPPSETTTIPEETIGPEEDEQLKQGVRDEPRLSLTLEDEDWYIPGVSRDIVTEMLETSDIGTFFVRDSQSRLGCYALTMKVMRSENNPTGFGNYLIAPKGDGFALQGFDKVSPDISSLIRHYSSYEDGLPCRLVLAGSNPLFHDANGYLVEFMDEEDDKYKSLSDCISMVREFNMNDPW